MIQKAIDFAHFLREFELKGYPTGLTPHQIIHTQGKSCVRYFEPEEIKTAPLFVSMPLINTWSVFDLLPHRSVVRGLLARGVPVYILDWGTPGPEDAEVGVEELLTNVLPRSIDRVRRHARRVNGAEELHALGYCVGGTFLAAYIGIDPEAFDSVSFLAAPMDFRHAGRLGIWADPESFPVDALVDNLGNFPASLMGQSFVWLRPTTLPEKYRGLWDRFEDPKFIETWSAIEAWNSANIPFWGEAYRAYIKNCYFDNRLIEGGWFIAGHEVKLSDVKAPVLIMDATRDHICPPAAAQGLEAVWGGTVTKKSFNAGHVGVCLSSKLPNAIADWLETQGNVQ
ncbi:MAG: alpha/beta fold hydrolase [Deltaproteobacteria bacterium]|nr:MAG: alpha/beta fold hydrolase [Deltaproteobacteria bacterium]